VKVQVKYEGKELERAIRKLSKEIDFEAGHREVAIALDAWMRRNFQGDGAMVGGWAPLAPSTIKRKEKAGKTKMLYWSGRLFQSFYATGSKREAVAGARVPYARYHQEGTSRMPARPILPTKEEATRIGREVFERRIRDAIKRAGL
jgi:phage gpG-like protein